MPTPQTTSAFSTALCESSTSKTTILTKNPQVHPLPPVKKWYGPQGSPESSARTNLCHLPLTLYQPAPLNLYNPRHKSVSLRLTVLYPSASALCIARSQSCIRVSCTNPSAPSLAACRAVLSASGKRIKSLGVWYIPTKKICHVYITCIVN